MIITTDAIKSAIAEKINNSVEASIFAAIYKEAQPQGFKTPAFFIRELETNEDKLMNDNYMRISDFVVRFHPNELSKTKTMDCNVVGNQLTESLAVVLDSLAPIRGTNIHYEVNDEVLQFFVSYRVKLKQDSLPQQKLEQQTLKQEVK